MKYVFIITAFLIGCDTLQRTTYDEERMPTTKHDTQRNAEKEKEIRDFINKQLDVAKKEYGLQGLFPEIVLLYNMPDDELVESYVAFGNFSIVVNMKQFQKLEKFFYEKAFYHAVAHYIDSRVNNRSTVCHLKMKDREKWHDHLYLEVRMKDREKWHDHLYLEVLMKLGFSREQALSIRGDEKGGWSIPLGSKSTSIIY